MQFNTTTLTDCYLIKPPVFEDDRGAFVKTFHRAMFEARGLEVDFRESFYSISQKHVLRGLHFQLPPHDHVKLVYCLAGQVIDVAVDLRKGSPSFGRTETFELSETNHHVVYLPRGFAHGFYVTSDRATLVYQTTSEHSPQHDAGILWNSAGIDWPQIQSMILSPRDQTFVALKDFDSPFQYKS